MSNNTQNANVITHSAAIAAFAKTKDIDTTRAGKLFRARLRGNADEYTKNGGKAHTKNSPWSDHPRKALQAIFPDVPTFAKAPTARKPKADTPTVEA